MNFLKHHHQLRASHKSIQIFGFYCCVKICKTKKLYYVQNASYVRNKLWVALKLFIFSFLLRKIARSDFFCAPTPSSVYAEEETN